MENRPNPAFARVLRARRKICPALPRTLRFRAKLKGRGVDRDQSGDGRFGAQGNESELTPGAGAASVAASASAAVAPGGGERRAAKLPGGTRGDAGAPAFVSRGKAALGDGTAADGIEGLDDVADALPLTLSSTVVPDRTSMIFSCKIDLTVQPSISWPSTTRVTCTGSPCSTRARTLPAARMVPITVMVSR